LFGLNFQVVLFGPFAGELFDVARVAFEVETVALEPESLGLLVAFSQGDDVGAEFPQELGFGQAVAGGLTEPFGGECVSCRQPSGDKIGKGRAGGLTQLIGIGLHAAGQLGGFLLEQPIAVAAGFPLGKILRSDAVIVEILFHDSIHFWQGIKPANEFRALLAVIEAAVKFFANFAW